MDYRPRYAQPFTLAEAVGMDVPIITEEIARLQNSLEHLKRTQSDLQEAIASSPDPVLSEAFDENNEVIGSQEERIAILKMALSEKGIHFNSHYDPQDSAHPESSPKEGPNEGPRSGATNRDQDNGGIDL